MKERVTIHIQSTQTTAGETETLETVCKGIRRILPDSIVILYREPLAEEAKYCRNKLQINAQSVTLTKQGAFRTEMIFRNGHVHQSVYQTPYGTFDLSICTSDLQITTAQDDCQILIRYSTKLNKTPLTDCTMQITIRGISD